MDRSRRRPLAPLLLLLLAPRTAVATFSIVAADARTRQVGGAGASCNPSGDVFSGLYLSAPNRSALHTQALLLERGGPIAREAREMMRRGERVEDVLGAMERMDGGNRTLSVGSFPSAELRQYGMVDFVTNGGYTGRSLEAAYRLAGMAEGTEQVDVGPDRPVDGRYSYRAMGNDVAEGTVASLQTGFLDQADGDVGGADAGRCVLARRLMAAMEAVRRDGRGDMRCVDRRGGITATGAYLHVDEPDGGVSIHINKAGDGSYEPIEELRREFLLWRERHGCAPIEGELPGEVVDGGDGADEAGATAGARPGGSGVRDASRGSLVSVGLASSAAVAAMVLAFWRV